jgi:hypothetical protein
MTAVAVGVVVGLISLGLLAVQFAHADGQWVFGAIVVAVILGVAAIQTHRKGEHF